MQDGDTTLHNDESQFELSDVVVGPRRERGQHRVRMSELFMPAKVHRALRRAESDSDSSDNDDDAEKASFDGSDAAAAAAEDDIEALLKRKSREGRAPRGGRHADEEAAAGGQQPAWASRGSDTASENNVLKVRCCARSIEPRLGTCVARTLPMQPGGISALPSTQADAHHRSQRTLVLPTVFLLVVVVLAAFFTGSQKLSTKANVYLGAKSKLTFDSLFDGTFRVEHREIDWLAEGGPARLSFRFMLHACTN